jgi:dolichol-phosphate mannosyltransferase
MTSSRNADLFIEVPMKFSVVIPCHNEAGNIGSTIEGVRETLGAADVDYEIVVVEDHCQDSTEAEVSAIDDPRILLVHNQHTGGFGHAVRCGLENFSGDAVAIMMADASDDPEDLLKYWKAIEGGAECAFGSRFIKGGKVIDYPVHKLVLNRMANTFIRVLFGMRFNDITNAFKAYRREVIEGCRPFLSPHFNLTVEIPLKAIVRGYSYEVLPISWRNRSVGVSKLKIREMGSRYLFIVVYALLEKWLTGEDYRRPRGNTSSA